MRMNGRAVNAIRPVAIERNYIKHADGSALIKMGDTHVICTATLEEKVPPFLKNSGKGWVTAEYAMLPRSTPTRTTRESSVGRISGRTYEIQRLVGRSLRAVTRLDAIGERTIWLDCDVIQADGGTRTAAITGAFTALCDALRKMRRAGIVNRLPLVDTVAAISVGIVREETLLDLDYEEDSTAEVDMNLVMTGGGRFVEIQGTAEIYPFSEGQLQRMIDLASMGIRQLTQIQRETLKLDDEELWR
ncbi:MAG: ribonuclease PH [Deltaproteobacteria bacterium]|nr:ribonuclease PH [Deltaproteobacteria bacterium]MBW2307685.1 ribonuclease PH [Deltaproteobacteria bacterium]